MAQDRAQRHHPGAAGDEQQRSAECGLPYEVAADQAPQLESVAWSQLVDEVGRDFAVVEPLDRQHQVVILWRRGDRVAALCLVAVLGGEAHVDVLAGAMPGPTLQFERDALRAGRLLDEPYHGRQLPGQSPW